MKTPTVQPYRPKPNRAAIAEQRACEALDLPAGRNYLTGAKAAKFRAAYSEAYMALAPQFTEDQVEVQPVCTCDWKHYPHRHSDGERLRFVHRQPMREVRAA